MSYCLNPNCQKPQNPDNSKFCQNCGAKILLNERYRSIKLIGQGGFGRTFLAVDEHKPSKPRCVIKQFFPQAQGTNNSQKAAELFAQEAVRLDELGKHPQIPELLAHFSQDNHQYLIQEFIDGQNLAQILEAEGTFTESQIRDLLNSLLSVLKFIHSHNVIHRDIKPENIIRRPDGELVLVDFGAAKFATGTALLKTGTVIGTPEYIAPEQARGKTVFASDLYSLGVTCIHLLTQVSPFDLFDINEDAWVWRQYLVNNSVSQELGNILDKLIKNAVNQRYQLVTDVIKDLQQQQPQINPLPITPIKPNIQHSFSPKMWRCVHTITGHRASVWSITFSPNGQFIASGSWDKTIKLWQLVTNQNGEIKSSLLNTLNGHSDWVRSVAISPNSQILVSGSEDKTIKLWQISNGELLQNIQGHSDYIRCVAFSPDGTTITSGSDDKTVKIWDVNSGQCIGNLRGHSNAVTCLIFSFDGNILASGSWDNTIKLWHLGNGNLINTIKGHSNAVSSIAFSRDSNILVSGSWDCTIKIWQLNNQELINTLFGHSAYVSSVAISPDGQTIASGSIDNTIKLWNFSNGELICTLKGHLAAVNSVAFSPDGKIICSGSEDTTIKIWQFD